MHERDAEKEKQNGRKGPRVMGMIMYAFCRAGSSSSVGTKPFRKSLLFQKSFETFAALVRLGYFLTASRCRSMRICFFISSMFAFSFFFTLCVSPLSSADHIAVLSSSSIHSWRKEGVCDGHRCTLRPLCPTLPDSLIRAERRLLVLTVSLPFPGIRLLSATRKPLLFASTA